MKPPPAPLAGVLNELSRRKTTAEWLGEHTEEVLSGYLGMSPP
jgi:hypothetical protein